MRYYNPLLISFLGGGLLTVLIASFFPIWVIWYDVPGERVGFSVTLWSVIWKTFLSANALDQKVRVFAYSDITNIDTACAAFFSGAFVALSVYISWSAQKFFNRKAS